MSQPLDCGFRSRKAGEAASASATRGSSWGSPVGAPGSAHVHDLARREELHVGDGVDPGATQFSIDWVERAWATVRRSSAWAASTAARSSSTVYEARYGIPPCVPPPEATTLMTSAPSATRTRTSRRISSSVSATLPHQWRCPRLCVMARPASCSRGPAK